MESPVSRRFADPARSAPASSGGSSGTGRAICCWRAGLRSERPPPQVKSDRIRDHCKPGGAKPAQFDQRRRRVQLLPESADQQRKPRKQRRVQAQENRKAAANQHNPTMHPATRAGKIRRFRTPLPGRRVNPPPLRKRSHILRARQSARKPRRQAVRQRAKRHLALPAIPTGNPHSSRPLAHIRAMTRQPAKHRGEPKAPRRACLKPTLPANVLSGAQTGIVTKLH